MEENPLEENSLEVDSKILKFIIKLFFTFIILGLCFFVILIGTTIISIDISSWLDANTTTKKAFSTFKLVFDFIIVFLIGRFVVNTRKERKEIFGNKK